MINTPALLMSSGSKLKKESDISLTVGQSSGYSMVRNGRAYPLTFYGYSSGELPISLLNTEASVSIVVATDAVSVFGSAPELEKLGIKGLFSTSPPLGAETYTWIYISKDSPIWKTSYEGLRILRTDIELQDGEEDAFADGYLGGESVKGNDSIYRIGPYYLFIDSGEVVSERPFIGAEDLNKTIPLIAKLLTGEEVGLNA